MVLGVYFPAASKLYGRQKLTIYISAVLPFCEVYFPAVSKLYGRQKLTTYISAVFCRFLPFCEGASYSAASPAQ